VSLGVKIAPLAVTMDNHRRRGTMGAATDRGVVDMSDGNFIGPLPGPPPVSVEELARQQGVRPIRSGQDMRADLWESDEEFDAFLADLRASRQADLG
jgi:hypothetical protein